MLSQILYGMISSASLSVGICSPLKRLSFQNPASNFFKSASVNSSTLPLPSVVRSTVWSCINTNFPSLESATSNSIICAPSRIASRNAAIVFSGCESLAPRCAQMPRVGIWKLATKTEWLKPEQPANSTAAIVISSCFISLQLSILYSSFRRVCGAGRWFVASPSRPLTVIQGCEVIEMSTLVIGFGSFRGSIRRPPFILTRKGMAAVSR